MKEIAAVPMRQIGPIKIIGDLVNDEVLVSMATYETPLWASTSRGARVSREAGGIRAILVDDRMTRSVIFEGESAEVVLEAASALMTRKDEISDEIAKTSRFAQLLDIHYQIVGNLLYLRFELSTGDASGHNMVTKAADQLMKWILSEYKELQYVSVSGNFCTDKKVSAVNGILGRGKYVVTEMVIPAEICQKTLKSTPRAIVDLHIKKNLIGTMLAGGLRSANAHFANMLLAFYLATGQDAANIIEGSQGMVHAEMRGDDLYFSATLPNVIVGTVGNGKELDFVRKNLEQMGCLSEREPGNNARRLAILAAATVFCGELSLLAALTNQGELMRSHLAIERRSDKS